MITQQQAEQLVYEHINRPNPDWRDKPELIIVRVEEHELGCGNSRAPVTLNSASRGG